MPSINLKKELYDTLIRQNETVSRFVNVAVADKLYKIEYNKQSINIPQKQYDYIEKMNLDIDVETFINNIVKEKLDEEEEKAVALKHLNVDYTYDQLQEVWLEHKDEITFMERSGRVDPTSLRLIAEKHLNGYPIGLNRSGHYRNKLELKHPEIKTLKKENEQ